MTSPDSVPEAHGRTLVLDSAVRLFNARGYHGTTMRDIARGADMTVASIYHHFASKQEILLSIMLRALHGALELTRAALIRAGGSPAEQLAALVRAWVLFHVDRQLDAVVGATELRSVESPGLDLVIALRDEQEALFREVVERGVEVGDFGTRYPVEATRSLISAGQSICMWWRPGGGLSGDDVATRYEALALATVEGRRG